MGRLREEFDSSLGSDSLRPLVVDVVKDRRVVQSGGVFLPKVVGKGQTQAAHQQVFQEHCSSQEGPGLCSSSEMVFQVVAAYEIWLVFDFP